MRIRGVGSRAFWAGLLCGIGLVLAGRWAINESSVPDRLVAPLLLRDSPARADAIVVLGGGVIAECVPNLNSMRRAIRGARLFKDERAPLLVITGGMAGGACPVADGMGELARELGVPAEHILLERESRSTWENAVMTAPLLRAHDVRRILLVTDRMHMRRAAGVFARQGFVIEPSSVPIYEGHPDNVSMLEAGLREAAALTYYRLRRWTADAPSSVEPSRAADRASQVERVAHQIAPATEDTIVVLGASYAANWSLPAIGGYRVINAGLPGQQSFEMLARFDRDVVAARPRAVVLWGFINDIYRAEDMDRSVARVRESYEEMVRRARANGIEPILATEVTVRAPKKIVETVMATVGWLLGRRSYQDQVNAQVTGVNQWLRDFAQREGLLLLDLQRTIGNGDGPRRWSYAVEDGSHISEEGYRALTEYAVPALERHLEVRAGRR